MDAVELLVGKSSQAINFGDRVATGALLTAGIAGAPGAFSFFGPKNALVGVLSQLQEKIPNEVAGSRGVDRASLLVAAHSVMVITSFFEVASLIQEKLPDAEIKLTGKEELQVALRDRAGAKLDNLIDFLVSSEIPYPKPELNASETQSHLGQFYDNLASSLTKYCLGLRFWDDLDDRFRRAVESYLQIEAPKLALIKYQDSLRRLATEVKEFEVWLNQLSVQAIVQGIRDQGAASSEKLDQLLAVQREASQQFEDLRRYLRLTASDPETSASEAELDFLARIQSMTQLSLVPPDVSRLKGESGIVIPPLSELYIEPPFKVITGRNRANVSKEEWWSTVEPRYDLDEFFGAYLTTSPAAFTNPLLVLGHPGSGKSSLTRVLAARLPESRYVPVRVELRRVSPRNTIEMQVEEGLSVLLGRNTTWQSFRQATNRTPVIFLDGLDELIQASEEKQTDYLEQVQLFQQRELVYGGAYVIVTSRTVVADHARIPPDAIVLKIDDFDGPEILAFTESWNRLNGRYFEEADMRPFPIELPEEVVQLAGQPLLLLLLALLDADGNALQSEGRTRTKASTYRQILTTFIGREMLKHAPQTTHEELARLINGELLKLAYVALGMFNRGAQLLSARQVGEDLQSLAPEPYDPERMDEVYKLLGRFFFVHQAQSNSPEGVQNAYEFLHSTFGEYLVAHLAHEVFTDVLDDSARSSRSRFAGSRNIDQWASILFAFQPFTQRSQILEFFAELTGEEAVDGTAMSDLLIALAVGHLEVGAGEMGQSSPYRPTELHLTGKLAAYTCNLILLACCIPTHDENRLRTRRTAFPATAKWDSLVHLWKSQLDSSAWEELSQMLWARSARRVLIDVDRVVDEVEIGLEFLAPATSSQYHLTPAKNCIGKPAPDVRMVISVLASEEKTRKIISGDTVFAPRGLVSEDVRVHFLASKDIRLVFDADDLLLQLLNPDLALVPVELVEPALEHLLRSPLCGEWLVRHLRVIVESPLADHFQPATFEQLVKVVQENLPRDLGLIASLIDVLVDADISASAYEIFHTVAPFSQREQFLAAHPGFALRVAVAFAKAGYHEDPDTSDWATRVTKVPLATLYEQDVAAPILAVTLARKHHFLPWATSRGIVEASALPGAVLRRMSIEDAMFLIRCGARDPLKGLQKVLGFGKAWADAHRGVREGRIARLADAIRRLPDSSGTSIRAVLEVLH